MFLSGPQKASAPYCGKTINWRKIAVINMIHHRICNMVKRVCVSNVRAIAHQQVMTDLQIVSSAHFGNCNMKKPTQIRKSLKYVTNPIIDNTIHVFLIHHIACSWPPQSCLCPSKAFINAIMPFRLRYWYQIWSKLAVL
jgi:hypothetical protein